MGKADFFRFAYDPLAAFNNAPKLLGMDLHPCGDNKMCGGYYLTGEPHPWRKDKIKVFISRGSVWVSEEGGQCVSLTTWLQNYGGASDYKDALRMIKGQSQALHWNGEFRKSVKKEVRFVDADVLKGAKSYDLSHSPLFRYMRRLWPADYVRKIWDLYNVTADFKGRTTFWYVNGDGKVCFDKKIYYREDGHRDKELPMGREYRVGDGYSSRCLFGAHLIPDNGDICVVESEKSALICKMAYPDKIWVATGGKSNLFETNDRFILYPDLDAIGAWRNSGCRIAEWWAGEDVERLPKNADIADLIIQKHSNFVSDEK